MKVLEEGKDVKWEREIECPHCRSKLLITATDVEFRHYYSYRDNDSMLRHGVGSYFVKCHEHSICIYSDLSNASEEISVDIPKYVKDSAMKRRIEEIERQLR